MDTIRLSLYLLVTALSVCKSSYVEEHSMPVSSHESANTGKERSFLSSKISNQPTRLSNIINLNGKFEPEHVNSLSKGLLSPILSLLNAHDMPSSSGYVKSYGQDRTPLYQEKENKALYNTITKSRNHINNDNLQLQKTLRDTNDDDIGPLVDADIDVLNKCVESDSYEQTTENGGSLVDPDVDILNDEEQGTDITDRAAGSIVPSVEEDTALKKVDSNKKDKQSQTEIDKESKGNPNNKESVDKYADKDDLEKGDRVTTSQRIYSQTVPTEHQYQSLPGIQVFSKIPLNRNIGGSDLYYLVPSYGIFPQRAIASERILPFGFFAQNGYPSLYPQSVASSNLYGASAQAQMIPKNRLEGTGEGFESSSGSTSQSSETTVETSETSVESSGTSI